MNKVLLTEREKKLLIFLTGFLAMFTIFIYGIQPKYQEYKTKSAEVEAIELKLKNLKAFEEKMAKMAFNTPAIESKVLELDKKLPNKAESAELVHYLNEAMVQKGLVIEEVSVTESEEQTEDKKDITEKLKVYSISIATKGNYDQLMGFLNYLEDFPRLLKVKEINWLSDSTNLENPMRGNYVVEVYSFDQQRPYVSNNLPYDKPAGRTNPFARLNK